MFVKTQISIQLLNLSHQVMIKIGIQIIKIFIWVVLLQPKLQLSVIVKPIHF